MPVNSDATELLSLGFTLEPEDGWPPVAVEWLPCRRVGEGFEVTRPPSFVKDLSVGDVIAANLRDSAVVESWAHLTRSGRSTIWILRLETTPSIDVVLGRLRELSCNTTTIPTLGISAVDVPASVPLAVVDAELEALDAEKAAVAFPSLRH